jgi:redox-sensitive bicupin YhaK (pirin superfamily)
MAISWQPAKEPRVEEAATPTLEMVIEPRSRDLGDGFFVRRVLPFAKRRSLGPFVFFDHFGPTVFPPGAGLDVRPHPHIGLATVTYLLEGEIMHRDSLGNAEIIRPGAVNWMTAGRGITHSERTPPALRPAGSRLYGVQLWVALPKSHEEAPPAFSHHAMESLPLIAGEGSRLRLIAGTLAGERAPVQVFSELFCADVDLAPGASLTLADEHEERGIYILSGTVEFRGERYDEHRLLVLQGGRSEVLQAAGGPARLLLLGGAALDGPRQIWWNFVASSPEKIERAKQEWKEGRFPSVPGDAEFIPLPD